VYHSDAEAGHPLKKKTISSEAQQAGTLWQIAEYNEQLPNPKRFYHIRDIFFYMLGDVPGVIIKTGYRLLLS
jgi:hypothetical protein